MRVFLTILFSFLLTQFAEAAGHAIGGPIVIQGGSFTSEINEAPLTAEEVETGGWSIDPDGACDLRKGCPYRNAGGFVRYLPLAEKKKLEAKKAEGEKKLAVPELATENEFNKALNEKERPKEQDTLVFIFTAPDCSGCKVLKDKLAEKTVNETKNLALYTLTRPTYATLEGHPMHKKLGASVGRIPTGLIYRKNADGVWEGKYMTGATDILIDLKLEDAKTPIRP